MRRQLRFYVPMVLQMVFWLALSVYLGGMVALGAIAAPAIFGTARSEHLVMPSIPAGMDMANQVGGEIFGHVLARFAIVEIVCLALMAVSFVAHLAIGRRPMTLVRWGRAIALALLAMVAATDLFGITPMIHRERRAWRIAAASSAEDAAAHRRVFDRLHRLDEGLGKIKVGLLAVLLVLTVAETPEKGEVEGNV